MNDIVKEKFKVGDRVAFVSDPTIIGTVTLEWPKGWYIIEWDDSTLNTISIKDTHSDNICLATNNI